MSTITGDFTLTQWHCGAAAQPVCLPGNVTMQWISAEGLYREPSAPILETREMEDPF